MNAPEIKILTKQCGKACGVEDLSFAAEEDLFGCLGPNRTRMAPYFFMIS